MATFGIGNTVRQLFSEDNGNLSSMRVLSGIVVVTVLGTWAAHCLQNNVLVGFDYQDIGLILGAMGVKAYQKKNEK